jgi:hypothetical protein
MISYLLLVLMTIYGNLEFFCNASEHFTCKRNNKYETNTL